MRWVRATWEDISSNVKSMKKVSLILIVALTSAGAAAQQKMFIYPKAGQGPDQQALDERECSAWALQQSGFDPMEVPSAGQAPEHQRGGMLGGA